VDPATRTPYESTGLFSSTVCVIFLYIILSLEVNRKGSNKHRGGWGLQLIQRNKSTLSISAEWLLFSVQHRHIHTVSAAASGNKTHLHKAEV